MRQGSTLLKVVATIMIVFGAIEALFGAMAVAGGAGLALIATDVRDFGVALGLLSAGAGVMLAIAGLVYILIGCIGVSASRRNAKHTAALACGVIGTVIALLNLFTAFSGGSNAELVTALLGLVLPVLYLVGVSQTRRGTGTGR